MPLPPFERLRSYFGRWPLGIAGSLGLATLLDLILPWNLLGAVFGTLVVLLLVTVTAITVLKRVGPIRNKTVLIDDQQEPHSCVRIEYRKGLRKRLIGSDEGVLLTSDGWLTFEGAVSRFSLGRSHGASLERSSSRPWILLKIQHEGEECFVRFENLPSRSPATRDFQFTLSTWEADPESAVGLACFPPTAPNPISMQEDWAYYRLITLVYFGGLCLQVLAVNVLINAPSLRLRLLGYVLFPAALGALSVAPLFTVIPLSDGLKDRRRLARAAAVSSSQVLPVAHLDEVSNRVLHG
ncbi:MAG TPA: hypothetical protein VG944_16290 [Fimbriimonas sp.]|nr:hypothetical protein [Fimbriimonas sp.]